MNLVVDASVAVKWRVPEQGEAAAKALLLRSALDRPGVSADRGRERTAREREKEQMVTADQRFASKLDGSPYRKHVQVLTS